MGGELHERLHGRYGAALAAECQPHRALSGGWTVRWRGEASDPFLMDGFDHKVVHPRHDAKQPVRFTLEVDFLGDGSWSPYTSVTVPATGYAAYTFPAGFSAEWVRVRADRDGVATAHFIYS